MMGDPSSIEEQGLVPRICKALLTKVNEKREMDIGDRTAPLRAREKLSRRTLYSTSVRTKIKILK